MHITTLVSQIFNKLLQTLLKCIAICWDCLPYFWYIYFKMSAWPLRCPKSILNSTYPNTSLLTFSLFNQQSTPLHVFPICKSIINSLKPGNLECSFLSSSLPPFPVNLVLTSSLSPKWQWFLFSHMSSPLWIKSLPLSLTVIFWDINDGKNMEGAYTVSNISISLVSLWLQNSCSSAKGQQKCHLYVENEYSQAFELVTTEAWGKIEILLIAVYPISQEKGRREGRDSNRILAHRTSFHLKTLMNNPEIRA